MPHQCLKCGRVFEEGSSQLLKGCPDCGGNRFFFTKEPLGETERDLISQEVSEDINAKIMELLIEHDQDSLVKQGKWISIKPREIRKMLKEKISEQEGDSKDEGALPEEEGKDLPKDTVRNNVLEQIKKEIDKTDVPETIDIEKPGQYTIDLKGLLEKEPIVIQKDGTYMIHLPSVFKMIDKER